MVNTSVREVENELLRHSSSVALVLGSRIYQTRDASLHMPASAKRPMSHSVFRRAPLLHRRMRRSDASEEDTAHSRPSRHAAKLKAFGWRAGIAGRLHAEPGRCAMRCSDPHRVPVALH